MRELPSQVEKLQNRVFFSIIYCNKTIKPRDLGKLSKNAQNFSQVNNFCFVKKSLFDRLINFLPTKKVALIRGRLKAQNFDMTMK